MPQVDVKIEDNSAEILDALHQQLQVALDAIGHEAEGYAKDGCPVDTGRLRNSISHAVEGNEVYIGTNVEYAPYIEYGTGIYAEDGQGRKTPWFFEDSQGNWHITHGAKPTHFLRNAATNHSDHYQAILEAALRE